MGVRLDYQSKTRHVIGVVQKYIVRIYTQCLFEKIGKLALTHLVMPLVTPLERSNEMPKETVDCSFLIGGLALIPQS